jgi:hypothetical protein
MSTAKKTRTEETVVDTASNAADYDSMLETISAVPVEKLEPITTPPVKLIAETEALSVNAKIDREALEKAGLEPGVIDGLDPIAGAFRFAVAELAKVMSTKSAWQEESPAAFELRDAIRHHFLFAYGDDPDKLRRVHSMSEGNTNEDMVQQLQNYSSFGLDNKEELERIGFDMSLLDKAAAVSARMGNLHGENKALADEVSRARLIRDQAYTCLKQMVAQVRKYGQYVFYRDETKRKLYASAYSRKLRNHQNNNADAVPEELAKTA